MFIFVLGGKLYVEKIVEAIIDNTIFFYGSTYFIYRFLSIIINNYYYKELFTFLWIKKKSFNTNLKIFYHFYTTSLFIYAYSNFFYLMIIQIIIIRKIIVIIIAIIINYCLKTSLI